MIAWAAAIPLSAMLGGVLIIAFGVVLARLKVIQYASELSADALAEIAGRDRGRAITGSGPFPSSGHGPSSADRIKSPGGRETRATAASAKTNDVKPSADNASSATKSPGGREAALHNPAIVWPARPKRRRPLWG